MKKYIFLLIISLISVNVIQAQDINQLLKNASKAGSKQKVDIKKSFKKMSKEMDMDYEEIPIIGGIDFMETYNFSECKNNEKQALIQHINNVKDSNGYETLILSKNEADNTRIMIKKKKDHITDLLIIHINNDTPSITRFSGKIKMENIDNLVKDSEKNIK
ncbi:MAG: DUF4252 domain-containing protein [Dysgonomonas sp.]